MTYQMHERASAAEVQLVVTPELQVEHARHKREALGGSAMTGFTLMEAVETDYYDVREYMEARVVDQQPAIDAIIDALDGSDARLFDDFRPRANLAFLGPTGVGKSEMAKALAEALGGDTSYLLQIDCSNYSHGHEVAGLIGSPVGYVGHDRAPVLDKTLIETEGAVVLFDEIEKGSPQLFDLMLQIMGNGRIRLNTGEVVSFKNAVVILTSNLGSKEMASQLSPTKLGFGGQRQTSDPDALARAATHGFDDFFRPEFVNRLDRKVVFQPLSPDGLGRVLDAKLDVINKEYEKIHGARLTLSDGAKTHLIEAASAEPQNGARPLIRAFEHEVQTIFGRYLTAGKVIEGTHVQVFHETEFHGAQASTSLVFASAHDASLHKAPTSKEVEVIPKEALFMPPQDFVPEEDE